MSEIQTAIFEHNGKLSVLPKSEKRPVTPDDIQIPMKPSRIGTEVIMNGRVMEENLTRIGRNEKWLEKRLKAQGYKNAKEIFLGVYRAEDDTLSLYRMG